ncbi:MAG: hypothetical protein LPK79_14040 [Bacteroidota bacterium]|nr:hypothetical protein [Bacteroidota bacterium]
MESIDEIIQALKNAFDAQEKSDQLSLLEIFMVPNPHAWLNKWVTTVKALPNDVSRLFDPSLPIEIKRQLHGTIKEELEEFELLTLRRFVMDLCRELFGFSHNPIIAIYLIPFLEYFISTYSSPFEDSFDLQNEINTILFSGRPDIIALLNEKMSRQEVKSLLWDEIERLRKEKEFKSPLRDTEGTSSLDFRFENVTSPSKFKELDQFLFQNGLIDQDLHFKGKKKDLATLTIIFKEMRFLATYKVKVRKFKPIDYAKFMGARYHCNIEKQIYQVREKDIKQLSLSPFWIPFFERIKEL